MDVPVQAEIVGGVDTHKDTHTAAAITTRGQMLGHQTFPATPAGYRDLLAWLAGFGTLIVVGMEGTSSYGAGLARYLAGQDVEVLEVDRPSRRTRRTLGKSDAIDAEAAARSALARSRTAVPKAHDGTVEAIRNLRVARRSAMKARTQAINQVHNLIVTAPEKLRESLRALSGAALITACAALRPDLTRTGEPAQAVKAALRSLARRHQRLSDEIDELDALLAPLVRQAAPDLLALFGAGTEAAGQLVVTAGQNPDRLHSEAAFAALVGASPIPASSGKTNRHRLNRGGDRQANAALHTIVIVRMRHDPATRAYVERRTAEGKTKKEIIRCLKRYVAREVYRALTTKTPQRATPPQTESWAA